MTLEAVQNIVENASLVEQEPPQPLKPPRTPETPFPLDALPPLLQDATKAIQDKTQAPLVTGAQSVLATTCLAVQPHADVETLNGSYSPLSCLFMTLALTGERKTSGDKLATQPLEKRETQLRAEYNDQYTRHCNRRDAWEKERQKIMKIAPGLHEREAGLNALGKEPEAPLIPILTTDDPTIQGVQHVLQNGWPGIGIFSSEAGQIIGGHSMNRENRLQTISLLSSLWDGNVNKRIRRGDGVTLLAGRRVCMHLMAQPGIAYKLLGDSMVQEQGFASRILAAYPDPTSGTRFYREASPESEAALECYGTALQSILETSLPLRDPEHCQNELNPRQLPMTPLAKERIIWYADEVEGKLSIDGEYDPIRGLANKLPEHALRIAGVLELSENLEAEELSLKAVERGITLAQFYAAETLRIAAVGKVAPEIEKAEKLRRWLLGKKWKEPYISLSDITQRSRCASSTAEARHLVAILQEHGWLQPVEGRVVILGNTRRTAWRIVREEATP